MNDEQNEIPEFDEIGLTDTQTRFFPIMRTKSNGIGLKAIWKTFQKKPISF